jgi:ABC-type lipoprotein export system ATPase subunit
VARLIEVSKSYPVGGEDVHAITGVTLTFQPGEVVALVGRSGSGKTTLLNLLGTLDRPTSGSILIEDVEIQTLPEEALLRFRRDTLGFVFQFFNLFPYLTALENAALPLWLAGRTGREAEARARYLLEAVGLGEKGNRPAGRLSGGEMQRVAIARALAAAPALVLADEPTGNLDQANAEAVMGLLRSMVEREGATLVVATHSEAVALYADRRVLLVDGRVASIH